MTLRISVIIPTYRREEPLRRAIASVVQQDYPDYELLIIDQTPQHEATTEHYLHELAQGGALGWWRVPWASLPAARNYGIRRSTGAIILFLDDDVEVPAGFLSAHARNFVERADIGAVAGRVLDRRKRADPSPESAIAELPPQALDPAVGWYYIDLVRLCKAQPVLTARGCNMSFRREVFDRDQLWFDERFWGSAVREESDVCLRMRARGWQIWYDPAAYLTHWGAETGGCHALSVRSLHYQITFYHNHFWLALKNLTLRQYLTFGAKLFDCHVLGHPPCCKSQSMLKTAVRLCFYGLGGLSAIATWLSSLWTDGQHYSRHDPRRF